MRVVVIGDDVVVTVLEVKGDGGVRLGIDAPRSTRVHRAEVYAAVKAANADAGRSGAAPSDGQVEQLLSRPAGEQPDPGADPGAAPGADPRPGPDADQAPPRARLGSRGASRSRHLPRFPRRR